MAQPQELKLLTDAEYADLNDRVDRFHTTWKAAGAVSIAAFLPPPRSRHRRHVLVELIKADMELRAKAGLPIRLEHYVEQFATELPADELPTALVAEEYALRHRYADKPKLKEFQSRFPHQFKELAIHLDHTPITSVKPHASSNASVGTGASLAQPTPVNEPVERTQVAGANPKMPPGASTPLGDGDILPVGFEYKLIRRIGRGAFGEVFEAEAPGGFRVAIKRILRDVDHPASQGEIASLEALKSITHPFVLQTQAYKIFQDRLVIVMELADGSLADRIEYHKQHGRVGVPPEELIPFFEQAGEALDYLHSQNVTHRDIKPQNLLHLKGYAKVADFGLAREQDKSMQTIGMEVGTPMFMAPEVWSQKVSIHSDQYSLAATYIQARLGRPLYDTKLMAELCHKHLLETPNLDPLPDNERSVLMKALAKKPNERYPSCVAFAKAMRAAVLLGPPLPPSRRWMLWLGLGAAAACGSTLAYFKFIADPEIAEPPPPPPPPLPPPQPWLPAQWAPENPDDIAVLPNGKRLHPRIVRDLGGERIVAILLEPAKSGDPAAYYMIENKLTNRAFAAAWELAMSQSHSTLRRLHDAPPLGTERYFPGTWKDGAFDSDDKTLGIVGDQAGVPVVGVTLPEAIVVAEVLGGFVPTYRQWLRAVDVPAPGPAGPAKMPNEVLAQRPLALGLSRSPWPVAKPTCDRGAKQIHQLTSNGYEWTRSFLNDPAHTVDLATVPTVPHEVRLVGQPWELSEVLTNEIIPSKKPIARWIETMPQISVRIVIEPT